MYPEFLRTRIFFEEHEKVQVNYTKNQFDTTRDVISYVSYAIHLLMHQNQNKSILFPSYKLGNLSIFDYLFCEYELQNGSPQEFEFEIFQEIKRVLMCLEFYSGMSKNYMCISGSLSQARITIT